MSQVTILSRKESLGLHTQSIEQISNLLYFLCSLSWWRHETDTKYPRHFSHTLMRIMSRLHTLPLPFSFQGSNIYYGIFGTIFILSIHMWNPLSHTLLILADILEVLCPILNSCNIRKQRSCFVIFIIEGFVCFKTIIIRKIITEHSLHSKQAKIYPQWIINLALKWLFTTQHFKWTLIL